MSLLKIGIISVLIAFYLINVPAYQPRHQRTNTPHSRNISHYGFHVEGFTCFTNPRFISNYTCEFRRVARERYSLHFRVFLIEPCNEIRVNMKLLYLYDTEERLLINQWEDVCGFYSGKVPSVLLNVMMKNVLKYSNMNHTCPYEGELLFKADRIDANEFPMRNHVPTGRYRVNMTFTNGPYRTHVGNIIIIFSNVQRK